MTQLNAVAEFLQVDRRSRLSVADFRKEYLRPQRPVVITDAIEKWQARSLWTFEYFRQRLGNAKVVVYQYDERREVEYVPEAIAEMTLGEYIDGVTSKDWKAFPYYLRDNWQLFKAYPELLQQHDTPPYFFDWFRFLPEFMRLPYPRIFIGPGGAITPLHVDIWGTHAWLSQLVGRKRWLLFSPEQAPYHYGHKVRCEAPDLVKYPLYREARPLETVIGPGDTIWVPGSWSHWVLSLDAGISLTYNYMGPGCLTSCLKNAFKSAFTVARLRGAVAAARRPAGASQLPRPPGAG